MNFPVWDPAIGSVWAVILTGIVHVFVSHIAIGGGLFLVVVETRAHRQNDLALLEWLKRHTRFFVYVTLVMGAMTGVGIWFAVSLVSPEATGVLIRTFLWVWAIEWVLFFVEVVSILVYAYAWDHLPRTTHRLVGWTYFASGFLSLVAIAPILSFQLTPGRWLATRSVWDAFFNPGFLPSVLVRTLVCLMLGGLFALLTVSWEKDRPLRMEVAKYASFWVWIPALLVAPAVWWYLRAVPAALRSTVITGTFVQNFTRGLILMGGLVVALTFTLVFLKPRLLNTAVALALMVLAFGAVGAMEWVREGLRKPYLIDGYLYANHMPVASIPTLRKKGLLPNAHWVRFRKAGPGNELEAGREIFRIACSPCHRPHRGFNPVGTRIKGLDGPFLTAVFHGIEDTRHAMPPFPGTLEEARALAAYSLSQAPPGPADLSGKAVWKRRCGPCHTLKGPVRAVKPFFLGKTRQEVGEVLDALPLLSEKMPPWTGTAQEKDAITEYLATLTPVSAGGKDR
jgi:mono/diheme cytochrome c family protein/cytochrome bd-type quinol oxidase subunit 1